MITPALINVCSSIVEDFEIIVFECNSVVRKSIFFYFNFSYIFLLILLSPIAINALLFESIVSS